MFLDYLLEDAVQVAAVDGSGVLVKIPHPARYAMHKLIISGERQVMQSTKASKDILQAASIIEVLSHDSPGDIQIALHVIEKRGKGWIKRLENGLKRMMIEYPVPDSKLFEKYLS